MDLLQGEQPEIWAQSDPPPFNMSVGDIRSQIAVEWLHTDSATVTMESLYETTIALSNGAIADPYDLPFPQNEGSICPRIREWPYLRNG